MYMYQRMLDVCSPPKRASGPGIDSETFFTNPILQEECLDHLTTVSRKKFSHYVSEMMDCLGYSYDMIKSRQQMFYYIDEVLNHAGDPNEQVTAGGKGEGTALFYENDIDKMIVITNVICTDIPLRFINEENLIVFFTDRSQTSAGYTRLKLLKLGRHEYTNLIIHCLFAAEDDTYYLSSSFFLEAATAILRQFTINQDLKIMEISGPSSPITGSQLLDGDLVHGFKCVCPDLLENWVSRRRLHGWPSPEIIHEVSLLDGHVVPVGCKDSHAMYREWRICFSFAELHLMRNFNETQFKVYILLKKICKSVLNFFCKDMTSYIMKNIVFWVCEEKGIHQFTRDMLIDRLFDCIIYLRACVVKNSLPSYMIPERNLFAGRLCIWQRHQLTTLLSNLLHEEGRMLLRCDQLRDGMIVMYKTPDMFREFSEKRDTIERLLLLSKILEVGFLHPGMSYEELSLLFSQNEYWLHMHTRMKRLMQIDELSLFLSGKPIEEINGLFTTRLLQILS